MSRQDAIRFHSMMAWLCWSRGFYELAESHINAARDEEGAF